MTRGTGLCERPSGPQAVLTEHPAPLRNRAVPVAARSHPDAPIHPQSSRVGDVGGNPSARVDRCGSWSCRLRIHGAQWWSNFWPTRPGLHSAGRRHHHFAAMTLGLVFLAGLAFEGAFAPLSGFFRLGL